MHTHTEREGYTGEARLGSKLDLALGSRGREWFSLSVYVCSRLPSIVHAHHHVPSSLLFLLSLPLSPCLSLVPVSRVRSSSLSALTRHSYHVSGLIHPRPLLSRSIGFLISREKCRQVRRPLLLLGSSFVRLVTVILCRLRAQSHPKMAVASLFFPATRQSFH
jgi:hypothetical protein